MTYRCIPIAALCVLSASLAAAAADKTNFSGQWKMNAAKSDFGIIPAPSVFDRKIDHKDPAINITTHQVGQQGEQTLQTALRTDGKETINKYPAGESKSTAKWVGNN